MEKGCISTGVPWPTAAISRAIFGAPEPITSPCAATHWRKLDTILYQSSVLGGGVRCVLAHACNIDNNKEHVGYSHRGTVLTGKKEEIKPTLNSVPAEMFCKGKASDFHMPFQRITYSVVNLPQSGREQTQVICLSLTHSFPRFGSCLESLFLLLRRGGLWG